VLPLVPFAKEASAILRKRAAPKKTTNEKSMELNGSDLIKGPYPIENGEAYFV
jgi:hypothetical protein